MASNFEGMTAQNKVLKNDKNVLSMYPNAIWMGNNSLEFLSEASYVKFNFHEKERNVTVYHNVNVDTIYTLFEIVKCRFFCTDVLYSWSETKIYGNFPKKEAEYREACRVANVNYIPPTGGDLCSDARKITIAYNPRKSDGSVARNPWMVNIKNGMSRVKRGKQAGSFYEGKQSFAMRAESTLYLTQDKFFNMLREQVEFFDDIKRRAKNGEIEGVQGVVQRLSRIDEWKQNSEYYEVQKNPPIEQPPQKHLMDLDIISEVQKSEDRLYVQCLCNNSVYTIRLVNVPESALGNLQKGSSVNVNMWSENDTDICATINQIFTPMKYPYEIMVLEISDSFNEIGNARCMVNGQPYNIYFLNGKEELEKSLHEQTPVKVMAWKAKNGLFAEIA